MEFSQVSSSLEPAQRLVLGSTYNGAPIGSAISAVVRDCTSSVDFSNRNKPPSSLARSPSPDLLPAVAAAYERDILPLLRALTYSKPLISGYDMLNVTNSSTDQQMMFTLAYESLLLKSTTNNFAGIAEAPKSAIISFVQHRGEAMIEHATSLPKYEFQMLVENLFNCAVEDCQVLLARYILSKWRQLINLDKQIISYDWYLGGPISALGFCIQHNLVDMCELLLENGAAIHERNIWAGFRAHARPRNSGNSTFVRPEITQMLFRRGFQIRCTEDQCFIYMLFGDETTTARIMEDLVTGDADPRVKILVFAISMQYIPQQECLRLVDLLRNTGTDLNTFVPHKYVYSDYSCKAAMGLDLRARCLLDVAICVGYFSVAEKLQVEGTLPTCSTFKIAMHQQNYAQFRDLLSRHAFPSKLTSGQVASILLQIEDGDEWAFDLIQGRLQPLTYADIEILEGLVSAAARVGHMGVLRDFLNLKAGSLKDLETRSRVLVEGVERAVFARHWSAARLLATVLAKSTDMYLANTYESQTSTLHRALKSSVKDQNHELVQLILDAFNTCGTFGSDICIEAIKWGELALIKYLVQGGTKINDEFLVHNWPPFATGYEDLKVTPMACALLLKQTETVEILVRAGAKLDVAATYALPTAVKLADFELAQYILEFGSAFISPSILSDAVAAGSHMLKLLLDYIQSHPDLRAVGMGNRALAKAISLERYDLIDLLFEHGVISDGADQDAISDDTITPGNEILQSPLFAAIGIPTTFRHRIVHDLLRRGMSPEATAEEHMFFDRTTYHVQARTPLLQAIMTRDQALVTLVLSFGADANRYVEREVRRTPLQFAAELGCLGMVQLLLDRGADPNAAAAPQAGATALQLAAIGGYNGVMELLLEHGADINGAKSRFAGRTAVEGAAEHGRISTVRLLCDLGAELEVPTYMNEPLAILLARENGHTAVVGLLQEVMEIRASRLALPGVPEQVSSLTCSTCGETLSNRSALQRHKTSRHEHAKQYECDHCGMRFARKDTFSRHIQTHDTLSSSLPCPKCGRVFCRTDYLRQHQKMCTNDRRLV